MTLSSASLYRYTPGLVGKVLILASRSMRGSDYRSTNTSAAWIAALEGTVYVDVPRCSKASFARSLQVLRNLGIRDLAEIFIPLPDSVEVVGDQRTNHLVRDARNLSERFRCTRGNRDDNSCRSGDPQRRDRRPHGRSRRQTVINKDDDLASRHDGRMLPAIL